MKNLCDRKMASWKLILILSCFILLMLPFAGCGNKGGQSGAGAAGTGSVSADLKDLDQKTPQMVCAEYFEAFRKRDMEALKRCTTAESFKKTEDGIKTNPSYEGVRNYSFKETTVDKEQAKVMVDGEIHARGKWVKTIGMILLKKDGGRWKVIEGKWEVPRQGREAEPASGKKAGAEPGTETAPEAAKSAAPAQVNENIPTPGNETAAGKEAMPTHGRHHHNKR